MPGRLRNSSRGRRGSGDLGAPRDVAGLCGSQPEAPWVPCVHSATPRTSRCCPDSRRGLAAGRECVGAKVPSTPFTDRTAPHPEERPAPNACATDAGRPGAAWARLRQKLEKCLIKWLNPTRQACKRGTTVTLAPCSAFSVTECVTVHEGCPERVRPRGVGSSGVCGCISPGQPPCTIEVFYIINYMKSWHSF